MSRNLPRLSASAESLPEPYLTSTPQPWTGPPAPPPQPTGIQFTRVLAAVKRYKWPMLGLVLGGTALGVLATRFIEPKYEAHATIYVASTRPPSWQDRGPLLPDNVLTASSWVDLFRSFAIADAAVKRLGLYLTVPNRADSAAFAGFSVGETMRPGSYILKTDENGRYVLTTVEGKQVDSGAEGDSIGRALGFRWAPPAEVLGRDRTIKFAVQQPRAIAADLVTNVDATLPRDNNILRVSLKGPQPVPTAAALNAWITEFVGTAADLKKRNIVQQSKILESQLERAKSQLDQSETRLASFRSNNIAMPNAAAAAQDPYIANYVNDKIAFDNARRDRAALEGIIAQARAGRLGPDAIASLPGLLEGPGAQGLKTAISDLYTQQAQLALLRQSYTDEYKGVRELNQRIQTLQRTTIPTYASQLVTQLRLRENALSSRVASQSRDLANVPARNVEEARLRREVDLNSGLYSVLQTRYKEAQVSEGSTVADVSILDSAVAPTEPSTNTAPKIIALALVLSLGLAAALAILLDQLDRRFRYPEQATQELGLHILGAVPIIKRSSDGDTDPEQAAQVIEAFRSLRLSLRNAFSTPQVMFTVSSPGAGDGKSMIASNLALSFAEAGYRTLLVDGDIRRGELHALFNVTQRPGLLDFLVGQVSQDQILRVSGHQNLTVIPCGARRQRGPEMLASPAMTQLMNAMKNKYDVIIVDSAPLGAGIDAYALGSATGNMLIVLRTGETDRKMAQAKLEQLDRFPVRILGAVMNAIRAEGVYRYYSYLDGYNAAEDEHVPRLASQVGEVTART